MADLNPFVSTSSYKWLAICSLTVVVVVVVVVVVLLVCSSQTLSCTKIYIRNVSIIVHVFFFGFSEGGGGAAKLTQGGPNYPLNGPGGLYLGGPIFT